MGWEENIEALNKLDLCDVSVNFSNEHERILPKLKTASRYSPIFKLHEVFKDENDPTKLSIMHININSLTEKFDTLKHHLHNFERLPDIICITETHLKNNDEVVKKLKICNYSLYVNSRTSSWGGVAMYVNNNFQVFAREDITHFEEKIFESLFLEIRTESSNFRLVCGVIYRTSRGSRPKFCEQLETTVKKINGDNVTACLCGDFNLDLTEKYEKSKNNFDLTETFKEYKQIMHQNNFFSCINRPTRFEKKTKNDEILFSRTLIDHIWCNKVEHFSNSAILVDKFADHLAVCCSLQTDQPHFTRTFVQVTASGVQPTIDEVQPAADEVQPDADEVQPDADEVQTPRLFHSSLKQLRGHSAYLNNSQKQKEDVDGHTDELVELSQKYEEQARKNVDSRQTTENAQLNREDRVAKPKNTGDHLDPFNWRNHKHSS